jgi:hypothetical protein
MQRPRSRLICSPLPLLCTGGPHAREEEEEEEEEREIERRGETAGEDVTAPESMTHAPMPGPPPHEEEETSGEDVIVLVSL